jgi:cytochrome c551/c552
MFPLAAILLTVGVAHAAGGGDPMRGAAQLESRRCTGCHRLEGVWGLSGLGKLRQSRLTPARLIGAIWSHAPRMWSGDETGNGFATPLKQSEAADLLAYFFAAGYFEPAGDAGRGAVRYDRLRCSICHGPSEVSNWTVVANPVDLLSAMWKHGAAMKKAMDQRKMAWPSLTIDDMRDLLSFIASRTGRSNHRPQSIAGSAERGKRMFQDKECGDCHRDVLALDRYPFEHSLTELAASLWNHAPMLTRNLVPLSREEVADVLAYLWQLRYFDEAGNALRGKTVFDSKGCGACHGDSSNRSQLSSADALRAVWVHYRPWKESRIGIWPRFVGGEMADLLAYWNSGGRRITEGAPAQGRP